MRILNIIVCLVIVALSTGCEIRRRMYDAPKVEPLEESNFFGDRRAARPIIPGTVARGQLKLDAHLYTGKVEGEDATTYPMDVTEELLARGQERYNIYCSVCHGAAGYGNGMVVQRGFKAPTSYHLDRLREAPPGYFYNVVANGFGVMNGYADQVPVEDRWAIVAYVKALQLSQHASLEDVPESEKEHLKAH